MLRSALRLPAKLQLLQGSVEFFPALIAALDAAKQAIHMESYLFDLTASGASVAHALERAALRGVRTRVMVDGVGCAPLSAEWRQRFALAGVEWKVFSPLGRLGMLIPSRWRRLHRKLVCVDDSVAFCGGINILDDFYDPNHGPLNRPRLDFSTRIEGPLVQEVKRALEQLWLRSTAPVRSIKRLLNKPGRRADTVAADDACQAALLLRDNLRFRTGIERAYRKAIAHAKDEIIIANAYFVPGRKLRLALIHAAQRGVKVRLLLQGRYEYFMQYYAARPVYGALLNAGVEIFEYSASFLHAKVAVVDGVWATVGSSNLDPLSLLLAREANLAIMGQDFAQDLRTRLLHAMQTDGQQMNPADYANRPLRQRCLEWVAHVVMRVGLQFQGKKYW